MFAQVSDAVSTSCAGAEGCYSDFVRTDLTVFILGAVAIGLVAALLGVALILQLTVLGWVPAAIWAVLVVNNAQADRRNRALIESMRARER